MKTNAKMNRKDTDIRSDPCIIEDIVELDGTAYAQFRSNLLQDYDFIGDRKDLMRKNDSGWHCLLVLGKGQNDGVLVESEGYSYARYSAYLPEARDFVNAQIKRLADYVVSEGTEHSEDGSWSNSYEEFLYHFDTTVTPDNGIGQLLREELQERAEVAECIMAEDCIEMTYHMEYCEQCQQGGIAGAMSLLSVIGCNFEDVHLCDANEEHDLATISELNENTLTEDGKSEWSDVLSAKVEKIYQGYYGLQIALSGVSPDRLRDFSFALAGQCSAEDFERWFHSDEPEQSEIPVYRNGKATDLIATYEELMKIPTNQKISNYHGDYGMHFLNYGTGDDTAQYMYDTALEKIRMDSDSFQGTEEFGYRTEIIGRMRACILSERLNDGEKVVFIPTEPLDEFDAIRYENGTVKSMDSDNLSCMIDCGQSQQIEIPLKNILAKYNPDTSMCCFGYRHAEPLCGMYDSIAEEMLEQAQKDYELSCEQDDSPVQSM